MNAYPVNAAAFGVGGSAVDTRTIPESLVVVRRPGLVSFAAQFADPESLGTHNGPLETAAGTIPASGKRQETPAAVFYVFEGDKIKASRHYFDAMTLLKQIDAQPK